MPRRGDDHGSPGTGGAIWLSRRNLVQDFTKPYVVFIDGDPVGTVRHYRTGRFPVAEGWHRVWARLPNGGDALMGDVVLKVYVGQIRRVRTTSRLKRMPPFEFLKGLADTFFSWSLTFPVDVVPRIQLRAWPPMSEDDKAPPGKVWQPRPVEKRRDPDSPTLGRALESPLAQAIRDVTFREAFQGYDPRRVDAHLAYLASTLEEGTHIDPRMVTEISFPGHMRGYNKDDVNRFLSNVRSQLGG